jgi:hypothetical protein
LVKKALKIVENSIRLREGNFLLQTMPTISGELGTFNAIQEQLNQMKNEANPVEGKIIKNLSKILLIFL